MSALADSSRVDTPSPAPRTVSAGAWLFRHRTWLPLPVAAALLLLPPQQTLAPPPLLLAGAVVVGLGEAIRLWGVRHIGVISRTRSDRLGPLVEAGPFAYVRNPLYVGNVLLWIGFAISARLLWLAPIVLVVLGLEYHAIVRWEERLLEARLGNVYRDYQARVARWIPTRTCRARGDAAGGSFSWRDPLFSERGTLLAIAAGYCLLWVKSLF